MNKSTAPPAVFLVDDDPGVLKAMSRVLREEGCSVETFGSAEEFLAAAAPAAEGCLVLDVSMPGIDGLALQRHLATAGYSLPVVFVSGHGDIPMSVKAIKAGASDFLTKPVQAQVLMAAISAAIAQERAVRDAGTDTEELRQRLNRLTPREREVLAAVTAGRRNKDIAHDLSVVEQTVKFHRARIMQRMEASNVAELMHMAARLGFGSQSALAAVEGRLNNRSPTWPRDGAAASATNPKASS